MPNMILKEHVFKRFGTMKSEIINIEHSLQSLGDFGVDAAVIDKNSRVNKIRLPFDLAAAQTRQNAVWLHQSHTDLGQPDPVPVPERKLAAGKIRIVENRVKPVGPRINRILIALGKEKRSAKAKIIAID